MTEEKRCKICGKLASEDSHFYPAQLLCNRHYLQIHRHGKIISDDELNLKIKPNDRVCSYCNTREAKTYYIWHKDDDWKDCVLCSKHYNQRLRHGDFLEEIEKRKECQVCGSKTKLIQSRKFHGTFCRKHFNQLNKYGEIKSETIFDRNVYIVKGEITEIILKNSKFEEVGRTIVDTEDLNRIIEHKWRLGTWGYAETRSENSILLQRFILNIYDANLIVDHINRNRLDNRKNNLRLVDKSENAINSDIRINNTSGITGVSWNKRINSWRTYINYNGNRLELGHYKKYEDAVRSRLIAEKQYYGDYAPQKHLFDKYNI